MEIIKNITNTKGAAIFSITGLATFSGLFYLMKSLPGSGDNMCIMGANLTPTNISFAVYLSISIGLVSSGLSAISLNKGKVSITGTSGFAAIIGILSSFCTICTLPIISLFGVSLSLNFITENNITVKIVSGTLITACVLLINRQLKTKRCSFNGICNVNKR